MRPARFQQYANNSLSDRTIHGIVLLALCPHCARSGHFFRQKFSTRSPSSLPSCSSRCTPRIDFRPFIIYHLYKWLTIHLINCKTNFYADDTALTVTGANAQDVILKLNSQLHTVADWFQVNRLSLNHDKTKYMFFGTRAKVDTAPMEKVTCGEKEIEQVYSFKCLGVKLDSTLSFVIFCKID